MAILAYVARAAMPHGCMKGVGESILFLKESNSKGAINMNLSGRKRRTAPWLSALLLSAFTCLIIACGSTSSTGSTGGQTSGGSTATPVSTLASTPTTDPPASTATPGSMEFPTINRGTTDFPGCGGQASLLSIRMLDQLHGWALNVNAILKTSDGGVHWNCVSQQISTIRLAWLPRAITFQTTCTP